jgi:hypothetical protein
MVLSGKEAYSSLPWQYLGQQSYIMSYESLEVAVTIAQRSHIR